MDCPVVSPSTPPAPPREIFGMHLFDRDQMKERLPEEVFRRITAAMEGGQPLDLDVADCVAAAMREWGLSKGATHYTHWFQPRTESTAEKHMAFLTLDDQGRPIHSFSGKELFRSEPDASSFPSGGMRSTFEARGYCAWDPSSPAFIVMSHKGGTLCIPSVFISFDGTPLDMKTPLLKSIDAVSSRAMRLLKLFGNRTVRSVEVTVGAEQEFFLLEGTEAAKRPDLEICSRTLIGAPSPKAQTVEAHYLGAIHPRVLSFMEDVERDMYRLGSVIMTRHNEAAPCQFEFAPVLAEANRGCDENHMLMEVMRKMARRHKLKLLLHEKPFRGVNGSGKHLNFSLRDSEGRNLLKPSINAKRNLQFLTFLGAFLFGMSRHGSLLRASIATPGNMHRLGGHEAPPSVMTVYLGDVLTQILDNVAQGKRSFSGDVESSAFLDLGLNRLPRLDSDTSDRNRTSPVAFTGNKWEFRGVGAPQAISGPLTICLSVWAAGLEQMADSIEARMVDGATLTEAALDSVRQATLESRTVRFEGNGYAPEWPTEARKMGLPVCDTTLEALEQYLVKDHKNLITRLGIMTEREIDAYYHIRVEQYVQTLSVEMAVLATMIWEGVLPALASQMSLEASGLAALSSTSPARTAWQESLDHLGTQREELVQLVIQLEKLRRRCEGEPPVKAARIITEEGLPLMDLIREKSDWTEQHMAAHLWPYPTMRRLLEMKD